MEQWAVPARKAAASTQGRENAPSIWENIRDRFTQLYSVEDKSLEEVMRVIEADYGLVARYSCSNLSRALSEV